MILEIKQLNKELFEANFAVMHGETQVGSANIKGKITGLEGVWNIACAGMNISMMHGKKNLEKGVKAFRPYDIFVNGNPVGSVYQRDIKDGRFDTYPLHEVRINQALYTLYPISFGEDGGKSPIYLNGMQIAEVHKAAAVINEMHNYTVYLANENYAVASILLCFYSYVLSFFRPGEKMKSSYRKILYVTKNSDILAKYNPDFVSRIIP